MILSQTLEAPQTSTPIDLTHVTAVIRAGSSFEIEITYAEQKSHTTALPVYTNTASMTDKVASSATLKQLHTTTKQADRVIRYEINKETAQELVGRILGEGGRKSILSGYEWAVFPA